MPQMKEKPFGRNPLISLVAPGQPKKEMGSFSSTGEIALLVVGQALAVKPVYWNPATYSYQTEEELWSSYGNWDL